jgi:predicted kinase
VTEHAGPAAVLVTGSPATGKSTLGAALAHELGAALIDQDIATAALVDVIASLVGVADLDDPQLAALTRTARYESVIAIAEANLKVGVAVVLVAPFSRERRDLPAWQDLERRLRDAGGVPLLLWLHLEPELIRQRLHARSAGRDLAKLRAGTEWLTTIDLDPPVGPHLALDAAAELTDLVNTVAGHTRR